MNYPAWIDQCGKKLPCLIADVSESGARLRVDADECADKEFTLRLSPAPNAARPCRVIWRSGNTLGVEFTSAQVASSPFKI